MRLMIIAILMFSFYVDVSGNESGNSSSNTQAGWASESSYGYSRGNGI